MYDCRSLLGVRMAKNTKRIAAIREYRRRTCAANNFEDWVMPVPESGCWIWLGCYHKQGYGLLHINGKTHKAHRFAYRKYNGDVPKGMCVLHKCDTPECCNPNHLFLGTQADNIKDMDRKKRRGRLCGEASPQSKLTAQQVEEIRGSSKSYSVLAKEYGVSKSCIAHIKTGRHWRNV